MAKAAHLMIAGARNNWPDDHDFYATPPEAVEALLTVEKFEGPIWEPACGDGAISQILAAHGYTVVSTDLYDQGYGVTGVDFLQEKVSRAPNIITNPPYIIGTQFAEQSLRMANRKIAMLMRLAWLEGRKRKVMFEQTGLSRVHVFSGRLPRMHRHGYDGPKTSSTIAFAWFVWDMAHMGVTELRFL